VAVHRQHAWCPSLRRGPPVVQDAWTLPTHGTPQADTALGGTSDISAASGHEETARGMMFARFRRPLAPSDTSEHMHHPCFPAAQCSTTCRVQYYLYNTILPVQYNTTQLAAWWHLVAEFDYTIQDQDYLVMCSPTCRVQYYPYSTVQFRYNISFGRAPLQSLTTPSRTRTTWWCGRLGRQRGRRSHSAAPAPPASAGTLAAHQQALSGQLLQVQYSTVRYKRVHYSTVGYI